MRKLTMLLVLAAAARAQGEEESPEVTKFKKKLTAAFIKKAPWVLDYDAARRKAKESGKVLFGYFTRSFQP